MMLFNEEGKITKYASAVHIIEDFAAVRLHVYDKRKAYMVNKLTRECDVLSAKARFIKLVIEGQLKIKRRSIKDLGQDLRRLGFKPHDDINDKGETEDADKDGENAQEPDAEEDDEAMEDTEADSEAATKRSNAKDVKDFEYLVGMPISTLTAERIEELMKQVQTKKVELESLKKKTIQKMWLDDLEELEKALAERDALIEKDEQASQALLKKAKAKKAEKATAKKGPKRAASNPPEPGRATKQRT